jgi:hypothetical protein
VYCKTQHIRVGSVTEINKVELNHFVVGFPNLLCCCLLRVDVGTTSHFSEVLSASIFRVEVNTVVEIQCIQPPWCFRNVRLYMHKLTDPTHFDPEDGSSMYLRNLGNIANTQELN